MKASDFVALYIEKKGVTHVFELIGGMITHLIDSFARATNVTVVSCHHEQAAAFAAEGFARVSRVPGVALATSGPGATNLLTAIGSCFFDSTATIFITGQVNTYELKRDLGVRQLGFQELDIVSMATPICKLAVQIQSISSLPALLDLAFEQAMEGRPGPCLIDIPMDIQSSEIDDELANKWLAPKNALSTFNERIYNEYDWKEVVKRLDHSIREAERPLMLMGGGCASPTNRVCASQIVHDLGIPVVLSLMAIDVLSHLERLRVGFIGTYGNRWANKALSEADLLIVIGSRLDIRQTGSNVSSFARGKEIWQFDIDKNEIGTRIIPDYSYCCSIIELAKHLAEEKEPKTTSHIGWVDRVSYMQKSFPTSREYSADAGDINPNLVLERFSIQAGSSGSVHYVTDVGQHQMWAAQSIIFQSKDRFITSGGMGAMGFGLPAAIGVALANPNVPVALITGDGSFQINIQELETLRRNQLDIKIILFNNHCHGMVRQFQETYFSGNIQSSAVGYSSPSFFKVALAYGIQARRLESTNSLDDDLDWVLKMKGPILLEVPLSMHSKVYPKLAFGQEFGEMEPDMNPVQMVSD